MNKQAYKKAPAMIMAAAVFVFSIYCTICRLPKALANNETLYMTAGLAMPASGTPANDEIESENNNDNKTNENKSTNGVQSATKPQTESEKTDKNEQTEIKQYGGEAYPVIENQYGTPGEITIKNTTDYEIDVDGELAAPLGFEVENTDEPQVLVVHTHATESYLQQDNGVYYSEYLGHSADDNENLTSAGTALADSLTENGITALHSLTHHDEPSYNGSYDRSAATIYDYLEKYPSIKVIIDFHRDALGYGGEDGKIKPTFEVNGKKAAQIMIMSGYDPNGDYDFESWEENLNFALKIQQKAEQLYPGMTRPLYFGDFAYNMNINSGSLLIEVGTDVNTLDEAKLTGKLLGNVLAEVLKDSMQ